MGVNPRRPSKKQGFFFFEKKKQKTFALCPRPQIHATTQVTIINGAAIL
jgi:hypothetical protein